MAREVVATDHELGAWLRELVDGLELEIPAEAVEREVAVERARGLLRNLTADAALALCQMGLPEPEVRAMLAERALRTDARIDHDLRALREPLGAAYAVSYTASRLIASWLEAQGQTAGFARLLREQLSPGSCAPSWGSLGRSTRARCAEDRWMLGTSTCCWSAGGGVRALRADPAATRLHGHDPARQRRGDAAVQPPALSKELLREDLPMELTLAEPMSWYERRGVELMLSTRVTCLIRRRARSSSPTVRSCGSASCCSPPGPSRADRRCPARACPPAAHPAGCGSVPPAAVPGRRPW